jgi:hypothetical protein
MEFHPEANQVEYVICPARIDAKVAEKLEQLLYMYRKNLIMGQPLKCFKLKMMKF